MTPQSATPGRPGAPRTRDVPVTDLTVHFVTGVTLDLLVRPEDTIETEGERTDERLVVTLARTHEVYTMRWGAVAYVTRKQRLHREREPEPAPRAHADSGHGPAPT